MLNHNIKGTGLSVTDELRAYVERQLAHAEKFVQGDSTAHADVELEHQPMRHGERNRAEFNVSVGGEVYRAESWGETLHAAIDLAIAQLQNELGRGKKKRLDIVRRSAHKLKGFIQGWSR